MGKTLRQQMIEDLKDLSVAVSSPEVGKIYLSPKKDVQPNPEDVSKVLDRLRQFCGNKLNEEIHIGQNTEPFILRTMLEEYKARSKERAGLYLDFYTKEGREGEEEFNFRKKINEKLNQLLKEHFSLLKKEEASDLKDNFRYIEQNMKKHPKLRFSDNEGNGKISREQYEIMDVDLNKLKEVWKKDNAENFIPDLPQTDTGHRLKNINDFIKEGKYMEMPILTQNAHGQMNFFDGRHRTTWMLSKGLKHAPMLVDKKSYEFLQKKLQWIDFDHAKEVLKRPEIEKEGLSHD